MQSESNHRQKRGDNKHSRNVDIVADPLQLMEQDCCGPLAWMLVGAEGGYGHATVASQHGIHASVRLADGVCRTQCIVRTDGDIPQIHAKRTVARDDRTAVAC